LNDAELAIIDKRRPAPNQAKVMHVIGDVEGQHCIVVDDMVDTAGTLCQAARPSRMGRASVRAYCTHAVLSGPAIDNLRDSALDELVVTDTIPLRQAARECSRIRQLSVAEMLAETMRRVHNEESVSSLFFFRRAT
jgi:ribose-phosphate pyrophosphokinase